MITSPPSLVSHETSLGLVQKKATMGGNATEVSKIWATAEMSENQNLIDEETLLKDADKEIKSAPQAAASGCATSKKACANCTCGRAEQESNGEVLAKVKITTDMLENPQNQGGCQGCSRGDAFRCAGCPYRGLPAFTPGQPIKIDAGNISDL